MTIYIPKALEGWLKEYKPTEGDLIFVAVTAIFAKMYGAKTFLEMESDDVKCIIWDKPVLYSINHLHRLADQGVIQVAKGLDYIETYRFNPSLQIKRPASYENGEAIKIELKELKSIMVFSYLLGRLADIRVNENGSEFVVIHENIYPATEGRCAKAQAARKQKHPDMKPKRHYVRKKPVQPARSYLNTIPHIYHHQLETKKQVIRCKK